MNSSGGDSEATPDATNGQDDAQGTLVINEVVAKSADGGSDWIELYVVDGMVSLGEYTIVDDAEDHDPQGLPDITLSAGEFLVIQAIDPDDTPPETGDYVTFKLGSDDCVTLYHNGQVVDELDWEQGDADEGESYGLLPDGTGSPQSLTPTPGSSNEAKEDDGDAAELVDDSLVINEVVAKPADGGSDWIELYVVDGMVSLGEYTIVDDAEDHDPQGLPDITLSAGEFLVIQAIDPDDTPPETGDYVTFKLGSDDCVTLYHNGQVVDELDWEQGDADEGESYGLLPDGTGSPQSLTPTPDSPNEATGDDSDDPASPADESIGVFPADAVGSLFVEIDSADWSSLLASPLDETYYPATVTYQGVTVENVAFRTKGNSSLQSVYQMGSQRYSFKIDTNYYESGKRLFGLKKLNLNNNYKDPTYLRERLAYDLMRELGVPAPRHTYVNLYLNGELYGLYGLVEQVDDEFVARHFENADGDLYKPDGVGSDLIWIGSDFSLYSGVELKTNEDTSDHGAFLALVNELSSGSDVGAVLDIDLALRYLAVSTALANLDSYQGILAHNYYLYEDEGVFTVIPWDFNEAFGTFRMGCSDDDVVGLLIDEPTATSLEERPLIARLLEVPAYREAYHGYLLALVTGSFDPDVLEANATAVGDLIRSSVTADPTAFFTPAEFEASFNQDVDDVFGLFPFVRARVVAMLDQLDGVLPAAGDGSGSCTAGGGGLPPPPPRN